MKQNKIYKLICYLWILVPVLSLIRLSQPMLEIGMGEGVDTVAAMPGRTYNGFQLLIHVTLVNAYNATVADMRNFGFLILKIMIVLQLISDVIIVFICLREWREKQSTKDCLILRGMLSIGYVLTALTIYRFVSVCGNHLQVESFHSMKGRSYANYYYEELEKNILFSIGVVILFIITWLMFRFTSGKKEKNRE